MLIIDFKDLSLIKYYAGVFSFPSSPLIINEI